MKLKGTPQERRDLKARQRQDNQVNHVRSRASQAQGHGQVVVACNAALAASRRCGSAADQEQLARMVAETVERFEAERRQVS